MIPDELVVRLPSAQEEAARGVLAPDPRPPYEDDPQRRYGMAHAGVDIRLSATDRVLTVRGGAEPPARTSS